MAAFSFIPQSVANDVVSFAMTYFHLKIIAAISMVIDHVGYVFFPEEIGFRIMGRLSFPIFAWLLVQGEKYTHNIWAYLGRLILFAAISQPFYTWLFDVRQLNILVTLSLGLIVVRLSKVFSDYRYLWWAAGLLVTGLVPMDAGTYGLGVILLMAEWRRSMSTTESLRWWGLWMGWHLLDSVLTGGRVQIWAFPTPLLMYILGSNRGPKARWFYGFYPGHLAALLAIKLQSG